MKVLFICNSNVSRSQIANAFFNAFSKKHSSMSAGIEVRGDSFGKHPASLTIEVMKAKGFDISNARRRQLTRALAKKADKIIVLLSKAELEKLPSYIKTSKKTVYWPAASFHAKGDIKDHAMRRDIIKARIKKLVKQIG